MSDLQTMPKPFAVFIVKRGQEGPTDPKLDELFSDYDKAAGRARFWEQSGYQTFVADIREALYRTHGLTWARD
jgi:hypothetical protein